MTAQIAHAEARKLRTLGSRDLEAIPQLAKLPRAEVQAMKIVATVLPFRTNSYVVDELIDWDAVPDDPLFQLTFPQREMLDPRDFARIERLLHAGARAEVVRAAAREIQHHLNPHPAGQLELNVPRDGEARLPGLQHKYRETVLFFPSQGQTCHAYCTYCFRWPQFVGLDGMRFASVEADVLSGYVSDHPEVTSVLLTGGDPLVMRASVLRQYIQPLLDIEHVTSIRLGTKSMAYWPQRFVTDRDADDLLRLFERVVASGKTLAFMAHYSHPRELSTHIAQTALARILGTGAVVRCQSPIVRNVNDSARVWSDLWRREVQLGAVPYYMFVVRDTGARRHFEVPLMKALDVYREALAGVSGLARTVRGPSMSATPGKVVIDGVAEVAGERVFVMRLLQARDPAWVGRPFFAKFDPRASWFDELEPAFGEPEYFFSQGLRDLAQRPGSHAWEREDARHLPILSQTEAA